jgi:hypothetical protein
VSVPVDTRHMAAEMVDTESPLLLAPARPVWARLVTVQDEDIKLKATPTTRITRLLMVDTEDKRHHP